MIAAAASLPGVRLGVISHRPAGARAGRGAPRASPRTGASTTCSTPGSSRGAVEALAARIGPPDRLFGAYEQLQVPLAEVRERLGIAGHARARRRTTSATRRA